eukprot:NODE_4061_length_363_cov_247.974522_g3481_i0.p1 GENE.NODE_4061_length_363_cov_247.974522_g3481_i0~~NODE_4061_length_363_cov_247.974522_g3481_i0.p1  ORF type:complete len:106 (+),score=21.83 NODE_4061_length_363_cov_247.974522_g3481_i0:25-318(+)
MGAVSGTSCASPTFAGVVGLLNDARLKAGKKPLGFLNPLMYKIARTHADAFIDVQKGDNGQFLSCDGYGFTAAKGWDPVTGLGAPNYENLVKYIMEV